MNYPKKEITFQNSWKKNERMKKFVFNMTIEEFNLVVLDIQTYVAASNTAEIREEVLTLKPSNLAEIGGISEELIIQQLGPQPELIEGIYQATDPEDWMKDRSKLREQYLKKKVKYQEERDKLIGKILSDYVGFELAQAIRSNKKDFLDNTSRSTSVAQFLNWLYTIIKKKIGVEGKKEEDDIRSLLTGGLTIKGCRGIRNYMARIEILLEQYTRNLADKQAKKNPYNANEEVLMEMTLNYVGDMIDADGQIIIAIYNEIVNYGLDKQDKNISREWKFKIILERERLPSDL
jgi:hypothetical protein